MKKYIRTTTSDQFETSVDELARPLINRVLGAFADETGFKAHCRKCYYRADLNAVLLWIGQYYNYGLTALATYTNPGRAKPSHLAMISLDASENEVYSYVEQLANKLITRIQGTFDSWVTISNFDGEDESIFDSETVISSIVKSADCDKARAAEFVRNLLDSGEVVNNLRDRVRQDDRGYYLVNENGAEVHWGTLYERRKNM